MPTDGQLDLTITLPVVELASLKRRIRYLEATIVQLMRGTRGVREWFTAAELEAMRLPGFPASKGAITRMAKDQQWRTRCSGGRNQYHFSTLPRRAFETLIDRVLVPAARDGQNDHQVPMIAPPPPEPEAPRLDSTPPWLLPLMRVVRAEAPATVREAVDLLACQMPKGATIPTVEEATDELRRLGWLTG